MNRGYSKEEYIQKVKKGREIIPDISFTTDVMVGFPTETDDDFKDTLDVIEQLKFDFAYMFKYSERPNTEACEIKPQVNATISQKRLTKLIEMQNQITNEKSKELLDKTLEVLVESKNGKQSYARTKTNKVVILEEPVETGKTYLCKVIRVVGWTPIGEIVNN
jgi:tRNA-2-methylthio-N6-dimethylallyladenosine synthase